MLYYFTITERAETAGMRPRAWSFNTNTMLTAIVAFSVQCFAARRVWILNRSPWQRVGAICLSALALIPLASGIACTVIMVFIRHPSLYAKCTAIIATWVASTAAVDLLTAALLSFTLWNSRLGPRHKKTDSMVALLIGMVVNTAVLTSGLAFADLATFWTLGNSNLIHWALNLNLSKVYVNTLLATLNSRNSMFRRPKALITEPTTIDWKAETGTETKPIEIKTITVTSTQYTYDEPSEIHEMTTVPTRSLTTKESNHSMLCEPSESGIPWDLKY